MSKATDGTMKHLWKHMWNSSIEKPTEESSKLANVEISILNALEALYNSANVDLPETLHPKDEGDGQ